MAKKQNRTTSLFGTGIRLKNWKYIINGQASEVSHTGNPIPDVLLDRCVSVAEAEFMHGIMLNKDSAEGLRDFISSSNDLSVASKIKVMKTIGADEKTLSSLGLDENVAEASMKSLKITEFGDKISSVMTSANSAEYLDSLNALNDRNYLESLVDFITVRDLESSDKKAIKSGSAYTFIRQLSNEASKRIGEYYSNMVREASQKWKDKEISRQVYDEIYDKAMIAADKHRKTVSRMTETILDIAELHLQEQADKSKGEIGENLRKKAEVDKKKDELFTLIYDLSAELKLMEGSKEKVIQKRNDAIYEHIKQLVKKQTLADNYGNKRAKTAAALEEAEAELDIMFAITTELDTKTGEIGAQIGIDEINRIKAIVADKSTSGKKYTDKLGWSEKVITSMVTIAKTLGIELSSEESLKGLYELYNYGKKHNMPMTTPEEIEAIQAAKAAANVPAEREA